MLESVLITADESDRARHAALFGCRLAKQYDAHVHVLHVFGGGSRFHTQVRKRDPEEKQREILDDIAELASERSVNYDTHFAKGRPHLSIVDHVEENDIDLVVMGRHSRSGLRERLLGTVTDRVLRRTNTPVLTVPSGYLENATDVTYEEILITTDGSEHAERAAPYGIDIAQRVDASLHLLKVVDIQAEAGAFDAGGVTDEFIQQLEKDGRKAIEQLSQHIDDTDVVVQSSVVRGTAHEAIGEYVAANHIDLIVIASKRKSNLASQSFRSITDRVLQTVNVPVLVIVS